LLADLERYHLLNDEQLQLLASEGRAFAEVRELVRDLAKRGWLTTYQANEVVQGRAAGLLLDSWVLLEKIGEGGMGLVYKARNWRLNTVVAAKVIRRDRHLGELALDRFRREIRSAAQLDHRHIVRAIDAGCVGGRYFLVMEYIEGQDLKTAVKKGGPLDAKTACDYVRQAAQGLQYAYERGLVHRDIKPSNLLCTKEGVVKILDMGLARREAANPEEETTFDTLTEHGMLLGTVDFMSPEQALDPRTVDIRSDLYSLGCTFYFLLTGQPPYPGGTQMQRIVKHREEPIPRVSAGRKDVHPSVDAVLERLLAKRAQNRFQTPAELIRSLEALPIADCGMRIADYPNSDHDSESARPQPSHVDFSISNPQSAFRNPHSQEGRWLRPLTVAIFVVVAVVAGGVWLGMSTRQHGEPAPEAKPGNEWTRGEEALFELRKRFDDRRQNRGELRKDLLTFLGEHEAQPGFSVTVATMLERLPSPLDQLQPVTVPEEYHRHWEVFLGSRDDLVAVLDVSGWFSDLELTALAVSPDGRHLVTGTASMSGVWEVWDIRQQQIVRRLQTGEREKQAAAYSPDGLTIALAGHHRLSLWDADAGKLEREFVASDLDEGFAHHRLFAVQFSADGRRILAGGGLSGTGGPVLDPTARLWDVQTGKQLQHLRGHGDSITAVSMDSAGTLALTCSRDGTVRLWDLRTGEEISRINGEYKQVVDGFLSPDDTQVVFATLRAGVCSAQLHNRKLVRVLNTLWAHDQGDRQMVRLACSPNGKYLASGGDENDRWVLVKNREGGQSAREWRLPAGVASLAFASDSRHLVVGDRDGTVWVFRIG
jgi:serine/threonine protein kinase/WD40 repeat protein